MTNEWGYVDPVQRVHEQQAMRNASNEPGTTPSSPIAPLPEIAGPQVGEQKFPEIFYGSGMPRYRNPREGVLAGAITGGVLGWMFGRWLDKRHAAREQRIEELKRSLGIGD